MHHRTNLFGLHVPFHLIKLIKSAQFQFFVVFDSELFEESRLRVKIATGAKETLPEVKLGSLASQTDSLPIELAAPSFTYDIFSLDYEAQTGRKLVPFIRVFG